MSIELSDGRVLRKRIEHAIGSLEKPMSDKDLERKFTDLAEGILPTQQTARIIETCWKIEALPTPARSRGWAPARGREARVSSPLPLAGEVATRSVAGGGNLSSPPPGVETPPPQPSLASGRGSALPTPSQIRLTSSCPAIKPRLTPPLFRLPDIDAAAHAGAVVVGFETGGADAKAASSSSRARYRR